MGFLDFLSPIASIGSAVIGGALGYSGQKSANDASIENTRATNAANLQLNQENNAFAERMSNTSWQRGVADMRAAGINPLLAFAKGGASAPTASSIPMQSPPPMQNTMAGIPAAMNSGATLARVNADINKVKSDTALNEQLKQTSAAQEELNKRNAETASATAKQIHAQTENTGAQTNLTNANTASINYSNEGRRTEQQIDQSWYGKALRYAGRLNPFSNSAATLMKYVR